MKKLVTPEIKIALVAIVGIVVLFFGMNFLKGLNLYSSDIQYNVQFDNVDGLSPTTPIYANGFKVGTVRNIVYNYEDPSKPINVGVAIDKDMRIPIGSRAEIVSDIMGNVKVNLIFSNAKQYLKEEGIIAGSVNDGVLGKMRDAFPDVQRMIPKIDSILTNIVTLTSDPALAGTLHNANKLSSELTASSKQLNLLLAQLNKSLPAMTMKANGLLNNTNGVMEEAKAGIADARSTLRGADVLMTSLNDKVNALDIQTTAAKLNMALDEVNKLTATLNSNKGSMGLLMNDPALYNNLNSTLRNVDSLVVNLKAHPKRYVHFSIFGRKDK
ncbi:MlaD family protein [Prevotella falsenii]|uniref:MlaD family protein n=1 Tax=Prevotella falsenii TaxID=515414 RepID=UPI00046ABAD5|nr:MlaD family protein [Prevotella falsenii]